MRFSEFAEEWERKKLGEVTEKINSGKTPLGGESVYANEGVLFIRSQNVNNDRLDLESSVFISEEINKGMKNSIVESNDILLNITGASLGRSCVVPNDFKIGNINQHVCIIRTSKGYNPRFIQPFLSSDKGQNIFESLQTGSGREGLNFENIKNVELYFPSLKEQNKISSFLSLLDAKIQTQNKIIEGLRVLKTALSKKVFSQKLRFSEFADEWETKKLEELCSIKKGEQLNKNDLTEFGTYPCLNGGINPSGYTEKYNSDEDTITISEGGNSCGYVNYMKTKFWLGGHCYKVLLNENINRDYFYHLLKCNEQKIMNLRVGSGLPNIQQNALRNLELELCISFDEQQKIASFLSAIDKKIEIETVILNLLTKQKQCLLRQMFV